MNEWKKEIHCPEPEPCDRCSKAETSECWPTEILEEILNEMGHEILRRGGTAVYKELPPEWKWNPEWLEGISCEHWDEVPTIALVTMFGEISRILERRRKSWRGNSRRMTTQECGQ